MLEHFYAEVNNKKGEDYEPESLKVMMASLDRHLKNKGCTLSIVRDREFSLSKEVSDDKAKQLRLAGRSWEAPNQSSASIREGRKKFFERAENSEVINSNRLNNSMNFSAHFCGLQTLKPARKMLF